MNVMRAPIEAVKAALAAQGCVITLKSLGEPAFPVIQFRWPDDWGVSCRLDMGSDEDNATRSALVYRQEREERQARAANGSG